ncbi:hypothetical protein FRC08_018507 [Ceratobasidium sp. 394]|nr:hypothetical protein FRC08_018507 [Ceratobasidium sp. 394]
MSERGAKRDPGSLDISPLRPSTYTRQSAFSPSLLANFQPSLRYLRYYCEGGSIVEYKGDSVVQVEENIQLGNDEEDQGFYSEAGPTTARTQSPARSVSYTESRGSCRTQTPLRTRTYDDDWTYDDDRTYDDVWSHNDNTWTYEDDARAYDDDAAIYNDAWTYEDDRSEARTYDEEGASIYGDGRSGYDDEKSAAYSNSGGRSEGSI